MKNLQYECDGVVYEFTMKRMTMRDIKDFNEFLEAGGVAMDLRSISVAEHLFEHYVEYEGDWLDVPADVIGTIAFGVTIGGPFELQLKNKNGSSEDNTSEKETSDQ